VRNKFSKWVGWIAGIAIVAILFGGGYVITALKDNNLTLESFLWTFSSVVFLLVVLGVLWLALKSRKPQE